MQDYKYANVCKIILDNITTKFTNILFRHCNFKNNILNYTQVINNINPLHLTLYNYNFQVYWFESKTEIT